MIKSQTLSIALPTNEKVEQQEMNKAKDSRLSPLLLIPNATTTAPSRRTTKGKAKNIVYYYLGKPMVTDENNDSIFEDSNLMRETFIGNDEQGMQQGIREDPPQPQQGCSRKDRSPQAAVAQQGVLFKERHQRLYLPGTCQGNPQRFHPHTSGSNYQGYTQCIMGFRYRRLDEMQINQISRYQIDNINATDQGMIDAYIRNHGN